MQTLTFTRLLFALTLFIGLSACQQDLAPLDDSLTYIPESATMVSAFKPAQLMEKADFESLKQTEGFIAMLTDANTENPVLARVLETPSQSGIDLNKNIYLATEPSREYGKFSLVTMSIADVAAFEALLADIELSGTPVSQNYQFAFPSSTSALAWNDEAAIIGFADKPGDLRSKLEACIAAEGEKTIANDKHLRKSLNKDYDIINWLSSDFLLNSEIAEASSTLLNYKEEDLKNNRIVHYLNFEKGKVESEAFLDFQGQIKNDLSMLFKDAVSTDFTALAPKGEPAFVLSTAFDVQGLNQLLIEKYSKGFAESYIKRRGISSKDLLNVLDGDIFLAAYPSAEKEEGHLFFMAKIRAPKTIEKLLKVGISDGELAEVEDDIYQYNDAETFIWYNNNIVYLSGSLALLQQAKNGDVGLKGKMAKSASAMMKQNIFTALGNPEMLETFNEDLKGIKNIKAHAGRKSTKLEIFFEESTKNSLNVIIEQLQAADQEVRESQI
jgi:hypothetical protein